MKLLLCAAAAATAQAAVLPRPTSPLLHNRAFNPLPVGSVTPKGWLLQQLRIQAEGLSGHLSMFWNDVMNSIWIGGNGDAGLHERAPYWLNGVVPLSFLLKNAGVEQLPGVKGIWKAPWGPNASVCQDGTDMTGSDLRSFQVESASQCHQRCLEEPECVGFVVDCNTQPTCWLKSEEGPTQKKDCRCYGKVGSHVPPPINLTAQVEAYISYILSHQAEDGWLGPASSGGDQYWGPSNVLFSLIQYAEGKSNPAVFAKASGAVLRHLLQVKQRMGSAKMTSWSAARWMDLAFSAEWLLDNANVTGHESELLELIDMLHEQGSNWEEWFESFTGSAGGHNVNNAQALKSAAVFWRRNASATYGGYSFPELSMRRMQHMDARYGLPHGGFNGDEILPDPPTRSPSRGFETCGVVEAMFSYNTMFSIHGNVAFADRAERMAYNALPATWASPRGGDMWAHQYLQAVNEINAVKADPHIWQHDGPYSETYGLEPNYGCCTANFNQGWPKFASNLYFTTPDGGVAVGAFAPSSAKFPGGAIVDVSTAYPFEDTVSVTVTAAPGTPVYIRIPAWAPKATVNGAPAANGTMFKAVAGSGPTQFTLELNPSVRLEEWDNGAVSVHRGALLFSLPIAANYTVYAHHFGTDSMSNDYFLSPTSPWQYALDVDRADPDSSFSFASSGYAPGTAPFNHSAWPVMIKARVRAMPDWGVSKSSATPPPHSPSCMPSPVQQNVDLYGGDISPCGAEGCKLGDGATATDCEKKCNGTSGCVAWVFSAASCGGGDRCYTKGPLHDPPKPTTCRTSRMLGSHCGDPESVYLVPHGGTELRIGEWPTSGFH